MCLKVSLAASVSLRRERNHRNYQGLLHTEQPQLILKISNGVRDFLSPRRKLK